MSKPYNCVFFVQQAAMPIYPYKCAECEHSIEVIQKITDPLLVECPSCGKPALVKQVTAAGFQLKGGGWYVTDFRDSGKKKEAGKAKTGETADAKPETASDGASDAKSSTGETKTETKSDATKPAPAPAAPPKSGTSSGGSG
jgi:putative FmdB family regulatory protein